MVDSFIPSVTSVTTGSQQPFYTECVSATVGAGNDFSLVQTGSGMTVTQVSGTNNSSYYEIAAGTTANSETILLSKYAFQIPATVDVALDRSVGAGVANNTTSFEIVEVDPTLIISSPSTAVVTSGTDTQFANARSGYQTFFQGGSTTIQWYFRSSGKSSVLTNTHGSTPLSQGTSPNFTPGYAFSVNIDHAGINKYSKQISSTYPFVGDIISTTDGFAPSAHTTLDPTKWYAIRLRVTNGGSAPASSISTRLYKVTVRPYQINPVDVITSPQNRPASTSTTNERSVPVRLTGIGTVAIIGNVALGSVSSSYVLSGAASSASSNSTNLGSSATYTGSGLNLNGVPGWMLAIVTADQSSGTNGFELQISNPTQTNWITIAQDTLTTTSGVSVTKQLAFCIPYVNTGSNYGTYARIKYTNGATAQGVFNAWLNGGLFSKPI